MATKLKESFTHRLIESCKLLSSSPSNFQFAQWTIENSEVFYLSSLSFGFVNLKPILPGHVLVCPRRVVKRFCDLTIEEVSDLWLSAQVIGDVLESKYKANSLTLSMQDGEAAGQTVNHIHVHVIPRFPNDFKRNDDIYEKLDAHDANRNAIPDDENRQPRTREEMFKEAEDIRLYIQSLI